MHVRVLVADATGALGRGLLIRLARHRHAVRAIARPPATFSPFGVEWVEADLLVDDLLEVARGCDAVVHVATAGAPNGARLDGRRFTAATRRLLDAAIACGVPRFVQQSFVVAYRDGGDRWLDEDARLDDVSRSAISGPIIEAEAMIREVDSRALAWTLLRGGSFVGAGTRQDALVDRLRRRRVFVAGDGSNYVSPLNRADMAAAVVAALERAPAGSTFNIVDEPLRYSDYVDALADLIGVERPPRTTRSRLPASRRCTNRAARATLGWMPRHSIWPSRAAERDRVRADPSRM